jgi:hypothetical protein
LNPKSKTRRTLSLTLVAFLILATGVFALFITKRATAKPCFSIDRVYYDDASHTNEIGEYYLPCAGSPWSWGSTSQYYEVTTEPCGGSGCPPF